MTAERGVGVKSMAGARRVLRRLLAALAVLLLMTLSFGYGVMVGRFKYPPFALIEEWHEGRVKKLGRYYTEIPPDLPPNDVDSLISIRSEADITARRVALVDYIWAGRGWPRERMPDAVEQGVEVDGLPAIANLKRVDRLTVRMEPGLQSVVFHFHPLKPNNRLLLFHGGHGEDIPMLRRVASFFVGRGYAVMAFEMPLIGRNGRPVVDIPSLGRIKLESHEHIGHLPAPLSFFVEPIVAALNYSERDFRYDSIGMTGLSGGGWTTTMCAALDERIVRSYPVAGSLPHFLHGWYEWGDFEAQDAPLYRIANFLDLYVMGTSGRHRRQMQVLNQFDEVLFYGVRWRLYEPQVKARLAQVGGGEFSVLSDATHNRHMLSDFAMERIAADFERD